MLRNSTVLSETDTDRHNLHIQLYFIIVQYYQRQILIDITYTYNYTS